MRGRSVGVQKKRPAISEGTDTRSDGALLGSVISLVVGAILGAVASKLLDETASLMVGTLSAVTVLLAAVVAFMALGHGQRQTARIEELAIELTTVRDQIGEAADLTFERFDQSTGDYYRRLERIVDRLKYGDHVYIMTHHVRRADDSVRRNEAHASARKAYLEKLLQKAAEGVVYRRIMCFEPIADDTPLRREFIREHLRTHCEGMLDLAASRPTTISVKKAPALLMTDIFIVNHEIGAISMETYSDAERLFTAGALIVHDPPNGRILDHLRAWWDEADAKSTAVRKNDLSSDVSLTISAPRA
jgi:hypothetical protein